MASTVRRNRLRYACALILAGAMVLATAAEAAVGVRTSNKSELNPAADLVGGKRFIGWSQRRRGRTTPGAKAMVKRGSKKPIRLNPRGTYGWMGGIDGQVAVYQEVGRRDSDIRRFNLRTRNRAGIATNGSQWDFWPTISGNFILFGRNSRFDSVILFNTKTGDRRTLARIKNPGSRTAPRTSPGQVNGNFAVFQKCNASRCKVIRYQISTRNFTSIRNQRPYQYGPSVTGNGTVYFAGSGKACGARTSIYRSRNAHITRIAKLGRGNEISSRTHAAPRPGGGTDIYFEKGACKNDTDFKENVNWDIFRVNG